MSAWLVWLTDILGLANMFDILGVIVVNMLKLGVRGFRLWICDLIG